MSGLVDTWMTPHEQYGGMLYIVSADFVPRNNTVYPVEATC